MNEASKKGEKRQDGKLRMYTAGRELRLYEDMGTSSDTLAKRDWKETLRLRQKIFL